MQTRRVSHLVNRNIRSSVTLTLLLLAFTCLPAAVNAQDLSPDNSAAPPVAPNYGSTYGSSYSEPGGPNNSGEQTANPLSLQMELSELEFRLFGRSSSDQNADRRLDKLERVVYGATSSAPIEQRVARLMSDIVGPPPSASNQNGETEQALATAPEQVSFQTSEEPQSLLELIGNMEQEVFGRRYTHDSLANRVARLEKTVLPEGSAQTFAPLGLRIHNLIASLGPFNTAAKYRSPKSTYTPGTNYHPANSSSNNSGDDHPLVHKLGKILSGVGTIAGEAIGSMAYGAAMDYGAYGWGYPGYFPGYYGGWGPGYGYGYGSPFGFYRW